MIVAPRSGVLEESGKTVLADPSPSDWNVSLIDFAIVNDLLLILVVGPTFVAPIPNGDRLTLMNAKPI